MVAFLFGNAHASSDLDSRILKHGISQHMQKSAVNRKVMVFKKTSSSMCSLLAHTCRVVWFEFVLNL